MVADAYKDNEQPQSEVAEAAEKKEEAVLTVRGLDEKVRVVRSHKRSKETTAWRLSVDLPRALIFTLQAGVAYLL